MLKIQGNEFGAPIHIFCDGGGGKAWVGVGPVVRRKDRPPWERIPRRPADKMARPQKEKLAMNTEDPRNAG